MDEINPTHAVMLAYDYAMEKLFQQFNHIKDKYQMTDTEIIAVVKFWCEEDMAESYTFFRRTHDYNLPRVTMEYVSCDEEE